MNIDNDQAFKSALAELPLPRQRQLGARFVENVLDLSDDPRVRQAMELAQRGEVGDTELDAVFKAAKSASVESFTRCGVDADWQCQAGHFVAEAAEACVQPGTPDDLAWKVAMATRMARNCAGIASGEGTENQEPAFQYQALQDFR